MSRIVVGRFYGTEHIVVDVLYHWQCWEPHSHYFRRLLKYTPEGVWIDAIGEDDATPSMTHFQWLAVYPERGVCYICQQDIQQEMQDDDFTL